MHSAGRPIHRHERRGPHASDRRRLSDAGAGVAPDRGPGYCTGRPGCTTHRPHADSPEIPPTGPTHRRRRPSDGATAVRSVSRDPKRSAISLERRRSRERGTWRTAGGPRPIPAADRVGDRPARCPVGWSRRGRRRLDSSRPCPVVRTTGAATPQLSVPFLGKALGIEDQDGLAIPQDPADMAPQLHQDRVVVPLARADEELDVLVLDPGAVSDRFGGLALQAADEATNDQGGVVALLLAIEVGEITAEEPPQAVAAAPDGLGCEDRIVEKGLGVGMVDTTVLGWTRSRLKPRRRTARSPDNRGGRRSRTGGRSGRRNNHSQW